MAAQAGYSCLVRKSGTSTPVTGEATALISASNQFRITNSAHRCIDPSVAWSLVDNGTTVAYNKLSTVDYLFGIFTFASTASSSASVVFNGSYLPITTTSDLILESRNFTLKNAAVLLDTTVFTGTTGVATRKRIMGLRDTEVSVEAIAKQTDLTTLETFHTAGTKAVVEINFGDGDSTQPRFRGLCKVDTTDRTSAIDGLLVTKLTFKAAGVDDDDQAFKTSGFAGGFSWQTFP